MRINQMFDTLEYYNKLTEAGCPESQARIMTKMLEDLDKIINPKDKDKEDGDNEI